MERLPWELLDKYFKKQITNSEQEILEEWIAESEEHILLFNEIDADIKAGRPFPGHFNEDTIQQWNEFKEDFEFPRYFSMPIKKLYRIAAAIMIPLLLAGLLGGYIISKSVIKDDNYGALTTIYSPGGQKTKVTLPDNSIVWLNAKTTLKYATVFNQKQRIVFIDGEAFFDVTHDQTRPFIVRTSTINIKVYGTTFNVKAYKDDDVAEATLVKGKITILGINAPGKGSQEIIIHPNETFRYLKEGAILNKAVLSDTKTKDKAISKRVEPIVQIAQKVDVAPIVAWKDGKLCFKNESFSTLAYKLEQWYDVKIHFEDAEVQEIKYTGKFEKENINQVLRYLQILTPFEYDMKLNEISIRYKKQTDNKKGGTEEILEK
ncbi:MAG: FecR family protein [Bacteroidetes bacterium]|nr:FecR family protein [Bacteroidota bacterium]